MAAGQKVEGAVLAAVGCLKLVPQAELPLVLQLQSDDGLTQGTSVLADHTESGTCGQIKAKKSDLEYYDPELSLSHATNQDIQTYLKKYSLNLINILALETTVG